MRHYIPGNMEELKQDLSKMTPNDMIIGGGTDLILNMRKTVASYPKALLYPGNIAQLKEIKREESHLSIGASCTMTQLSRYFNKDKSLAAIANAAAGVGSEQIRNRATIGGNIANASPAGDLAPVLYMLGADVVSMNPEGIRRRPISEFIMSSGKTLLEYNETIISFQIPLPADNCFTAFVKVGSRRMVTISRLGLALLLNINDGVIQQAKVVLGAVSERPFQAADVEKEIENKTFAPQNISQAGRVLSQLILDINKRSNREYKSWVAPGVLAEACALIKRSIMPIKS